MRICWKLNFYNHVSGFFSIPYPFFGLRGLVEVGRPVQLAFLYWLFFWVIIGTA
jgi:hypothetical protein